jgi:hypothetical protein
MPSAPRSIPDLRKPEGSPAELPAVHIRDLAARETPGGVWLPEINSATDGPQSHAIYHELVKHAHMRLKRTREGRAMVAVTEGGAVHLLNVPSPEFFRFVDRFRMARRLRVLPEFSLSELARIIEARVGDPRFQDDRTLLPGEDGQEASPPSVPPPVFEAAQEKADVMAYALNRLVLSSPYVFVPSVLADALGEPEGGISSTFAENRERLRAFGFETRTVSSSLGPVFLVSRIPSRKLDLRPGKRE